MRARCRHNRNAPSINKRRQEGNQRLRRRRLDSLIKSVNQQHDAISADGTPHVLGKIGFALGANELGYYILDRHRRTPVGAHPHPKREGQPRGKDALIAVPRGFQHRPVGQGIECDEPQQRTFAGTSFTHNERLGSRTEIFIKCNSALTQETSDARRATLRGITLSFPGPSGVGLI